MRSGPVFSIGAGGPPPVESSQKADNVDGEFQKIKKAAHPEGQTAAYGTILLRPPPRVSQIRSPSLSGHGAGCSCIWHLCAKTVVLNALSILHPFISLE